MANDTGASQQSAWGYPDTYSVFPNSSLNLHVSSTAPSVGVRVYTLADWGMNAGGDPIWASGPLLDMGRVAVSYSTMAPNNAATSGVEDWNWPQNVTVAVGAWPTGIYITEIAAYASASSKTPIMTSWVMFVVKNPSPVAGARMLYKWNINTIYAYNQAMFPILQTNNGGWQPYDNDFYENPATAPGAPADSTDWKITLRRPCSTMWDVKSITYDYGFVTWLQKQGYEVDFCTDVDIEIDTQLTMLSNYPAVLFRGHDEYLGAGTYTNLTNYRDAGGNIAFFSGNTCCWRVTFGDVDPNLNIPTSFTCNKGPKPICDIDGPDSWWVQGAPESGWTLGQYDNRLVGVGTRNAGITWDCTNPFSFTYCVAPYPMLSPGYTIQNSDHWILASSGAAGGFVVGVGNVQNSSGPITEALIGYEAGGARLNDDGSGQLTFTDGTPPNFVVLGVGVTSPYNSACDWSAGWEAFNREGMTPGKPTGIYAATMGLYSAYGSVFTAATVHWVMILDEWDFEGGFYQGQSFAPTNWAVTYDPQGHPILGNQYLHYITRSVLDAFMTPVRTVGAIGDLNGDGMPDLLLQSAGTGEPSYWLMNGTAMTASGSVLYPGTGTPGSTWRIAGIASLTSATSTEAILQNRTDGSLQYWTLQYAAPNLSRAATAELVPGDSPGVVWLLCAVLDMPAAPGGTLLFQNQENGSLWYWQFSGTTRTASAAFVPAYVPGNDTWQLVAAVDLNGDGNQDLIFQSSQNGSLYFWILDGLNKTSEGAITGPAAPGQVVGAGNFATGVPYVVFQNTTTGALAYWTIANFQQSGSGAFSPTSNPWFLGTAAVT